MSAAQGALDDIESGSQKLDSKTLDTAKQQRDDADQPKQSESKLVDNDEENAQKREVHNTSFTGWREVAGWEPKDTLTADDELMDLLTKQTFLENSLPEVAYGDWYHNFAALVLGATLCWIVGRFKLSLALVFFIVLPLALYYRTSIRKFRGFLRRELQREFVVRNMENDYETMNWLNVFLDKYWIFLEPGVSKMVCEQVNPILANSPAPAFIKQLWLGAFTAGTKPPRIDMCKTLAGTNDDVSVMDWGVSFTPNTLADATVKQMRNRINQKVIVKLKLFGLTLPIVVSDISFRVLLRVRLRMMSQFPHVRTVNLSLVNPPEFDFSCRIFGGDSILSFEILSIPGLKFLIDDMIKKYIGRVLFDPLSFQLNVPMLLAGEAFGSPSGIIEINVKKATHIKAVDTSGGNTVDPYVIFSFGGKEIARTSTIEDTREPIWNETIRFLVSDFSEPLHLDMYDFNDFRKDQLVGNILYDLGAFMDEDELNDLELPILRNNKRVGTLHLDMKYMPIIHGSTLPDGSFDPPPELNSGITSLTVVGARGFNESDKVISVTAEVYLNKELINKTGAQKSNDPKWNSLVHHMIDNRADSYIDILLRDGKKNVIGALHRRLIDVVDSSIVGYSWFPLNEGGEVELKASWGPVELPGGEKADSYVEPIGVARIFVDSCTGLPNLERIGVIDPYVRILVNNFQRCRTLVQKSTVNPVFKEVLYVTVASPNQKITIEAMDVEKNGRDRTLGAVALNLAEFVGKNDEGKYIESRSDETKEARLISSKGVKGTIKYSIDFFPTIPVVSQNELNKKAAREKEKEEQKKKLEEESEGKAEELKKAEKEKAKTLALLEELEKEQEEHKLNLSFDELIKYQQGVFVYDIISGDFGHESGYLQVYFDQNGYSQFTTRKIRKGGKHRLGVNGDYLVKELEYSQTVIRYVKDFSANRLKNSMAEVSLPTIQLLQRSYDKPYLLKLPGQSGTISIYLQCSWIPVLMSQLPFQDSIGNSGQLSVTVLKGKDLPSADRNGKSDPFCEIYLNDNQVYKTKKIKRTLNPEWNESFDVEIGNRCGSILNIDCIDWDVASHNDKLGSGHVSLADIDPMSPTELTVPLKDEDGLEAGEVYLRFVFRPKFVILLRPETTAFSFEAGERVLEAGVGAGGKVIGAGVGAGGKVLGAGVGAGGKVLGAGVGTGGKVVGRGASLLRGLRGSEK
ncbi:hypothetical protein LJB42_002803 [Komagataella kurtzmanii]|nr:hypothetical protein LJB42_002803 [Komagataella kurtzmanii]